MLLNGSQGWDKTFCLQFLGVGNEEYDEIHFFGDKTFEVKSANITSAWNGSLRHPDLVTEYIIYSDVPTHYERKRCTWHCSLDTRPESTLFVVPLPHPFFVGDSLT